MDELYSGCEHECSCTWSPAYVLDAVTRVLPSNSYANQLDFFGQDHAAKTKLVVSWSVYYMYKLVFKHTIRKCQYYCLLYFTSYCISDMADCSKILTCCPRPSVSREPPLNYSQKHPVCCFGSRSVLFVGFRCSYKMIELILSVVFLPQGPFRGKLSRPDFSSLITRLLHFQAFDSSPLSRGIRWELLSQHFLMLPSVLFSFLYSVLVKTLA